jgi:hypothetical protein
MLAGLALLVTAVRLSTPSLVLFLAGGALIGAGAGLVFKGTTGIVLEAAAPEERVAMTSTLIMTALFGLSIPVIGAGVALSQGVSAATTVLGFGTAVALGVASSGWALLSRGGGGRRRRLSPDNQVVGELQDSSQWIGWGSNPRPWD